MQIQVSINGIKVAKNGRDFKDFNLRKAIIEKTKKQNQQLLSQFKLKLFIL